ncbi:MAG: hypothetical protein WCP70_07070 [Methanothrix sp.]
MHIYYRLKNYLNSPANTTRPSAIAATPDGPAHRQWPMSAAEREQQSQTCGCPALFPVACKNCKAVERIESLRVLCAFVPLWFGP